MLHVSSTFRSALFAVLATLACTQRDSGNVRVDSIARNPQANALAGMRWVVVTIQNRSVRAGSRITMEATDTTLGGYGGCNWYGGDFTLADTTLKVEPMTRTMRACVDEGITEQENTYLQLLQQSSRFQRTGDTLRLFDREGGALVVFRGQRPLAMRAEDLEGSSWQLAEWRGPRRVTGPPARPPMTLAFEKDRMKGFAGCRNFTGSYRAEGDVIGFPTLSMVEMDCSNGGMLEREGRFTTALSESSTYRLEKGKRLELYTPGGDTLVFTPAS